MIAQIAMDSGWFGISLTAVLGFLLPGIIALVRMWGNVANHATRIEALENDGKAIAELRDDMAAVKTDMQWVRRALEKK